MPHYGIPNTEEIVRNCYDAWAKHDLDAVVASMAENCVYTVHVPVDVLSFAGPHHGRQAIRACLTQVLEQFSFLAHVVDALHVSCNAARAQVVYYYLHTGSGEQIDGRIRHVWRVEKGEVVQLDEYHDVERLRAFVQMVRTLRST